MKAPEQDEAFARWWAGPGAFHPIVTHDAETQLARAKSLAKAAFAAAWDAAIAMCDREQSARERGYPIGGGYDE